MATVINNATGDELEIDDDEVALTCDGGTLTGAAPDAVRSMLGSGYANRRFTLVRGNLRLERCRIDSEGEGMHFSAMHRVSG